MMDGSGLDFGNNSEGNIRNQVSNETLELASFRREVCSLEWSGFRLIACHEHAEKAMKTNYTSETALLSIASQALKPLLEVPELVPE